ncbi:MAG: nuclear transport factor 2 family protein, partial [Flavobacteriales bacterium]|nr:nuclear transport factor 2 family protein [Flavobacteriales bacterium]
MSTIADLEGQLLSAMRSHDTITLDRLLGDDLLFTDHLGRHITKAGDLAEHASGRMTIDELVPS